MRPSAGSGTENPAVAALPVPGKPQRNEADRAAYDAVTVEQIRLLLENPADVPLNMINAGLAALIVGRLYPVWVVVSWLGLFSIVSLARAMLRRYYATKPSGSVTPARWGHLFALNALVAGCLWGLAASIFVVTSDSAYYNFIIFVLGGTMAGGIVCTASHLPSMLAFNLPVISPVILVLAIRGGPIDLAMAVMLTLFTFACLWTGRAISRSIVGNVRLRVEQEILTARLQASEAAMAEAQKIAHVGTWTLDLNAHTDIWSEEMNHIFGVDPATFTPCFEAVLARVHPDDRKLVTAGHAEILATGTNAGFDHRIVMDDGSIKHIHQITRTTYDSAGRPARIIGTVQDITERKNAENELQFANSILKNVIEASPYGIMVISPDRNIILYNQKLGDIWNVPREDRPVLTLETALLKVTPLLADPQKIRARIDQTFDHPGKDTRDQYVLTDGRTVDHDSVALRGSTGEYLGRVWYFRDITEIRKDEQKVAFTDLVLKTQMEASLDGIVVVDETKMIVSFNRRFADMWKIPAADLAAGRDGAVLRAVAASMKDPLSFTTRVQYLYDHPGEDSQEELEAADGRAIDRHSVTLYGPTRKYLGRAWFFRDITERKRAEAQALRLARFDVLTGLANRAVFVETLGQSIESAERGELGFAVLYLDLDRFKDVNDTLGHPVGDELLQAVADRLRAHTRITDTVARFGGDEFALIVSGVSDPTDAAILADKLIEALAAPFSVKGSDIHTGASIGIAIFGADAPDAETLLSRADLALYRAKSEGRGSYRFFTSAMDTEAHTRVTLGAELRVAIDSGQLFLVYQPQVEIANGRITGLEALVRWRHPTRGILVPDLFIPIAEQMGMIGKLGRWVLLEACRQGRAWLDAGIPPVRISVNVSALQFRAPLVLEADIAATLAQTGFPPRLLELELTESVLMDASHEHSSFLERLRLTGVSVAIDDFGTGYSSLEYLRKFPSSRIKIAQSFVTNLHTTSADAAIVRATIGLARELKIDVVAEGVETQQQCDLLKKWGCCEVQGFHFAQPLPTDEAARLLRAGKVPLTAIPLLISDGGKEAQKV